MWVSVLSHLLRLVLESGVGSVGTINLCDISSCIKFPPSFYLEPGADFININIIDYRQLGVETRNK